MAWRRFLYDVAMLSKSVFSPSCNVRASYGLNGITLTLPISTIVRHAGEKSTAISSARKRASSWGTISSGRRGGTKKPRAAEEAKSLLRRSPQLSAAEVPMVHGGLYARADALVRDQDGYILRETKASSFPLKADKVTPDKPEEHHLNDISIQAWVMSNSGLPMTRSELNLLNSRWRYSGNGDYAGLFRQMDVSAQIGAKLAGVPAWVEAAERTLRGDMPEIQTGRQCHDPDECPFQEHCRKFDAPSAENPIELLPDAAGKALAKKLRETKGYVSILEPNPAELSGKQAELYRRIQEAHRTGQGILAAGSVEIMNGFPYPRYFFDFEGIDLAVPRWAGVRPYEQIPFQWSCHIECAAGIFEHAEFLLNFPGVILAALSYRAHAREIVPDDGGPIFVYYATYERGRLNELGERHPAHAEFAQKYVTRLVDLLPIVKQHFYHPSMRGSFSIKKVLPVVAPDLNYAELQGVQEGTGAQVAYIDAALNAEIPPNRKAAIDQQLRTYCRQDTWAMVEIAHFLAQAGRPPRPVDM